MKNKTIYFGEPNFDKREIEAVRRVMLSKWVGFGQESVSFEKELKSYLGISHGAVMSSCTAALHLALILNGLNEGDEVITTPLTFAATANVLLYFRARPVFVDIDPDTLNIDPDKIQAAITERTKGILVVHFGGLPCEMEKINALARERGLFVVEDSAHAIGAKSDGRLVGSSANIACFSFYSNKNLTSVEGGFMSLRNAEEEERVQRLRLHGLSNDAWKRFRDKSVLVNEVVELGYKYNITDLQSAIGRIQLKKLEKSILARAKRVKKYDEILGGVEGIRLQKHTMDERTRHALHLYTVAIDPGRFRKSRDEIVQDIRKKGIFAVVHYHPVHLHELYREKFGYKQGDFPMAEKIGNNIFTIPLLPQLSLGESVTIARTVKKILEDNRK